MRAIIKSKLISEIYPIRHFRHGCCSYVTIEKIDRSAKASCPIVIKRILIIDDDESFRKMLRHMLESQGYQVMEACDGEAGIHRQIACPADMIISDLIMPKNEGIEAVLTIKENILM